MSAPARLTNHITLRDEAGQTAVEYAMVMTFIALVIAAVLASGFTDVFSTLWTAVTNAL